MTDPTKEPANPHRGEVAISLKQPGGEPRDYVLRPSFQALLKIEVLAGVGAPAVLQRFTTGTYTVRELVAVIHSCLVTEGDPPTFEVVGEMVYATGVTACGQPAADVLVKALDAGARAGEVKAADGP